MANKDVKNVKRFIEDVSIDAAKSTYGMFSSVNLSADDVYEQAEKAYESKTLVQIIDSDGSKYVADTITLDGTNIVLTKGGKTITIANDNTITNVGDIQTTTLELFIESDDFADISDFDSYIITKELYDKLLSGKYVLKTTLYDDVDFIGFPNWVGDDSNNTFENVLVDTHYIMQYWEATDNGLCFVIIGQLKDERYFIVCDTNFRIINA